MSRQNGMNYAPQGKPAPVCNKGEFVFAAVSLDHGHIYGMCNGLIEAGGYLKWVYDSDIEKVNKFVSIYPDTKVALNLDEILQDDSVQMVAAAAINNERASLGIRVMEHGKDYFTDKPPLTSLEQLDLVKSAVNMTKQKYAVYFSERLHVESAVYAGQLVDSGAIGRVIQVIGLGPHRISLSERPKWFFNRIQFGGILCDIGSHQIEQFMYFSKANDAKIISSKTANYHHKEFNEFEDFGDATILADNGATNYFRVDWFTPDGLNTWGDGRTFILGTKGYIELRKYTDIGRDSEGDQVYLVDNQGQYHYSVHGEVGYPFFGQLILDCLNRTENAMTQEHAFKAAELSILAQMNAIKIE